MEKIILEIEIQKDNKLLIDSLYKSLIPDNVDIPEGIELVIKLLKGNKLYIKVASDIREVLTLRNTVDDIIRCIIGILNFMQQSPKK